MKGQGSHAAKVGTALGCTRVLVRLPIVAGSSGMSESFS